MKNEKNMRRYIEMDGVDFYLLWCWCGNGIIGDDNNEEDGAEGGATNFEGREALIMDGGGNNGDGLGSLSRN